MEDAIKNLLKKIEAVAPVEKHMPADEGSVNKVRLAAPQEIPQDLILLWQITDGIEINVPGTRLYSVAEATEYLLDDSKTDGGLFPLGSLDFGDNLYINATGEVIQIDHENGEVFLTWRSLIQFLEDELLSCEG